MSENSYGGESNAKKIARAIMWSEFRTLCVASGRDPSWVPVAALCGPYGHDVRCARAHGFNNVTAIDRDPEAIRNARGLLGDAAADWRVDDFCEVLRREAFGVVFLDSCSLVLQVTREVFPSMVAQAGRKVGAVLDPDRRRARDLHMVIVGVGGIYGRDARFLDDTFAGEPDLRRIGQVTSEMVDIAASDFAYCFPTLAVSYTSRRKKEDGGVAQSPMLYAAARYWATGEAWRAELSTKPYRALDPVNGRVEQVVAGSRKNRRFLASISKRETKRDGIRFERLGHDLDGARVRRMTINAAKQWGTGVAADTFCVDEGTVRAWLAHDTRGTYARTGT